MDNDFNVFLLFFVKKGRCNDIVINTFYFRSMLRHWHYDNRSKTMLSGFRSRSFSVRFVIKRVYILSVVCSSYEQRYNVKFLKASSLN